MVDDDDGTTCAEIRRRAEIPLVIDLPDTAARSLGIGANAETSGIMASRHTVAAAPRAPLVRLLAFAQVVEVAAAASGGPDILLSAVDSRRLSFIVRDDQRNKETLAVVKSKLKQRFARGDGYICKADNIR